MKLNSRRDPRCNKSNIYNAYDPEVESRIAIMGAEQNKGRKEILRGLFCEMFCIPHFHSTAVVVRIVVRAVNKRCEAVGQPSYIILNDLLCKQLKIEIEAV